MKILHIIDSMNMGGAENLLLRSVDLLNKNYHFQNTILTFRGGGVLEDAAKRISNYTCLSANAKNPVETIAKLRQFLKGKKFELVHAHLFYSMVYSRLVNGFFKGVVGTYHTGFHCKNSIEYSWKQLFVDRFTYRPEYFTIYVSNAVKNCIASQVGIKKNHAVVPNFVTDEFQYSYQSNSKLTNSLKLIAVGSLREQKNYQCLLEALGKTNDIPIHLDIYGDGSLKPVLEKAIKSKNLPITIYSNTLIDSKLLGKYDLFIMTSLHEGMPLALMEALTSGLPAVLNDIPELRETAADTAFYFRRNDPEDLALLLSKIYKQKETLADKSILAQKTAQGFKAEKYISSIEHIYSRLLR